MSLKEEIVSNAEGAQRADLIPMRDEPENEKLLMNANRHDELGRAQLERDGGSACRQEESEMGAGRHRLEVLGDYGGDGEAKLPAAGQAGTWGRAWRAGRWLSASAASRTLSAGRDTCAWTRCIKARRTAKPESFTSMPSTP